MILRRLELKSFGQFVDKKYEFRHGMNLVIGPNEAGKSTMMEAIPSVLFGLKEKKRYRPWARSLHCSAAVILENQQSYVSIERDIDTDHVLFRQFDDLYQEQNSLVATLPTDSHCAAKLDYLHMLRKFIGVSDERLFRSSLFLGQGDFPSTTEEIKHHMRVLLSGFARGDSTIVLRAIQDDYSAITNDVPWSERESSPRELEAVQDALEDLHGQRTRMQLMLDELEGVRKRIESLQQHLDEDRSEYDKGVEYLHWIQLKWQQDETSDCPSINGELTGETAQNQGEIMPSSSHLTLQQECHHLEQILIDAGLPTEIPEDLPPLLASADDIRCSLVALHQQTIPVRKQLAALSFPNSKFWLLLSLLLVSVLAVVGYFYPTFLPLSSAVIGGGVVLCWSSFAWRYRQQKVVQKQLQHQIDGIERQRDEERSRLQALDDDFESYGFTSSAIAMVKMKKQLEGHEHIIARLAEVRTALQCDDSDRCDSDDVGRETTALSQTIVPERCQQNNLRNGHLQPDELPEAEKRLQELKSKITTKEVDLLALQRQEAVLQDRVSDAERLGTTEAELRRTLSQLQERKQVLHCAYSVLDDAIEEFTHTNLRALEKEISEYLRQATLGRYVEVKITEDYALRLRRSGQRGRNSPLENFSRGTIDLVCLATRLALTRFLSNDEYLPFFLDDALVNLDSNRMLEVVDALERLSRDHQIIMFTHDERLSKLAGNRRWNIISLGAQSRRHKGDKKKEVSADGGQLSFL